MSVTSYQHCEGFHRASKYIFWGIVLCMRGLYAHDTDVFFIFLDVMFSLLSRFASAVPRKT